MQFSVPKKSSAPIALGLQSQSATTTTLLLPANVDLGACATTISTSTIHSQNPNAVLMQQLYVQTSTNAWSAAMLSTNGSGSGYCLRYPKDWTIRVAGAAELNLMFNDGAPATGTSKQMLFVQLASGDSLENADKATTCYECYGSNPSPLVDQSETMISRRVETVGDNQVLFLQSNKDSIYFNRYFIVHSGLTLMFQSEVSEEEAKTQEYVDFLSNVIQVVSSTRFGP